MQQRSSHTYVEINIVLLFSFGKLSGCCAYISLSVSFSLSHCSNTTMLMHQCVFELCECQLLHVCLCAACTPVQNRK